MKIKDAITRTRKLLAKLIEFQKNRKDLYINSITIDCFSKDADIKIERIEYQGCCVVDANCEYPANLEITEAEDKYLILPECFACGSKVCKKCSKIMIYSTHGRKRICNNCKIEYQKWDARIRTKAMIKA